MGEGNVSPPQQPLWRRLVKYILRPVVSIGLLTFLLLNVDLQELGSTLGRINVLWFLAALAALLAARSILALRWVLLLRARGTRLSLWRAIQINLIGSFFNTSLPSTIGGDVVRAHRLAVPKRINCGSVYAISPCLIRSIYRYTRCQR